MSLSVRCFLRWGGTAFAVLLGVAVPVGPAALAQSEPSVEVFTDQAVPPNDGSAFDHPMKAGDMVLSRVPVQTLPLSTPLPVGSLQPPKVNVAPVGLDTPRVSSANIMLMEGMRNAFLQAGQNPNLPSESSLAVQSPETLAAPSGNAKTPLILHAETTPALQPPSLGNNRAAPTTVVETPEVPAAAYLPGREPHDLGAALPYSPPAVPVQKRQEPEQANVAEVPSVVYQPGREPRDLSASVPDVAQASVSPPVSSPAPVAVPKEEPALQPAEAANAESSALGPRADKIPDQPLVEDLRHEKTEVVEPSAQEQEPAPVSVDDNAPRVDANCGTANGETVSDKPETDLCEQGLATDVSGKGPWQWHCVGQGGGKTASCEAQALASAPDSVVSEEKPVENTESDKKDEAKPDATETPVLTSDPAPSATAACGTAAEALALQTPTDNLCSSGKAGAVSGAGPWTWDCSDESGRSVLCSTPGGVAGSCGNAANVASLQTPAADLCNAGEAGDVTPNADKTRWQWECQGSLGAVSASCSAPTGRDAIKSEATPSAESAPAPALVPENKTKDAVVLEAASEPAVESRCGPASGQGAARAPKKGLCEIGKASSLKGNGPWRWTCAVNNGAKVSCEAPKLVKGVCGASNDSTMASKPKTGLCASGTPSKILGKGPWSWSCLGKDGGSSADCSARLSVPVPPPSAEKAPETVPTVKTEPAPESNAVVAPVPETVAKQDEVAPSALAETNGAVAIPSATPTIPSGEAPLPVPVLPDEPPQPVSLLPNVSSSANPLQLDAALSSVAFATGSDALAPKATEALDQLAALLQAHEGTRLTLTAYASAENITPLEARRMSLARALAVRDYLVSKGAVGSHIDVRALGSNVPSGSPDRVDVQGN